MVAQRVEIETGRNGNRQVYETMAQLLRSEIAQTLGYVVVQLVALAKLDESNMPHERALEVRGEVREELRRVLVLIDDLEVAGRAA